MDLQAARKRLKSESEWLFKTLDAQPNETIVGFRRADLLELISTLKEVTLGLPDFPATMPARPSDGETPTEEPEPG